MSDAELSCAHCGFEELVPDSEVARQFPESVPLPERLLVDLADVPDAFRYEEGFSRPSWERIAAYVAERVNPMEFAQAWTEIALQWLITLREELGGDYHVTESPEFFLLSALDQEDSKRVLEFAEKTVTIIREQLQHVAWTGFYGKHVILLFTDDDDFHQYRAPLMREGVNVAAGGFARTQATSILRSPTRPASPCVPLWRMS
jgi:hypothetical protein